MILEDDLHLAEFCRSSQSRLEALARFLTKGSDVDAEDLTQDTLQIFVRRWKNGTVVADPEKYTDGIMRKLAKRALQGSSERRRTQVPLEQVEEPWTPDVASAVEDRAKYELLHHAVSGVPNRRQRNFLTWSLEGASIPEIAEREFKESGRRSSAHQVSCVLDRGRGQLSASYKRRGGWRVILPPLPFFDGLRRRAANFGSHFADATNSVTLAALANTVVAILMTVPGGAVAGWANAEETETTPPSAAARGRVANVISLTPPAPEMPGSNVNVTYRVPRRSLRAGDDTTGRVVYEEWREESSPPASPEAWLADIVGHPERLLPQCGGLPVCGAQ